MPEKALAKKRKRKKRKNTAAAEKTRSDDDSDVIATTDKQKKATTFAKLGKGSRSICTWHTNGWYENRRAIDNKHRPQVHES